MGTPVELLAAVYMCVLFMLTPAVTEYLQQRVGFWGESMEDLGDK